MFGRLSLVERGVWLRTNFCCSGDLGLFRSGRLLGFEHKVGRKFEGGSNGRREEEEVEFV